MNVKKQMDWINAGKFVAILAVIIDHCYGIHENYGVRILTFLSVSLFILLSGVTTYFSCERQATQGSWKDTVRRIGKIFIPYAVATAVYQLAHFRVLNFEHYYTALINFNAGQQFYYVLFYMQLILIAPFLFDIIQLINKKKHALILHIVAVLLCSCVAALTIRFTIFPGFFGGAANLLGGTYLILFYIGMAFSSCKIQIKSTKPAVILAGVSTVLLASWVIFLRTNGIEVDFFIPFGNRINPPGILLMVYALLAAVFIFGIYSLIEVTGNKVMARIAHVISKPGKYTLYIFLYHYVVLDLLLPVIPAAAYQYKYLLTVAVASVMVLIPVLLEIAVNAGKTFYRNKIKNQPSN